MSDVCQAEVAKYIYEPDDDSDELQFTPEDAMAVMNQVCPNECSARGQCVQG